MTQNTHNREMKILETHRHPKPTYSADHRDLAGMEVPRGGSMCANCKFLKDEEKGLCGNPHFIAWNFGSNKIPGDIHAYCSDWFEPAKE